MFQKISEWLADCDSHAIYTLTFITADFATHTGHEFPAYVRTYSLSETKVVMDARGLGGTLAKADDATRVVWGYKMAADFARHLVKFQSAKMGRGRIFAECIQALKEQGK